MFTSGCRAWLENVACLSSLVFIFSPAGFMMCRGYWSRMVGHFRLSPPSWTDWHTWPRSRAGINPTPDKMNLDYLKLLYCEFQKYEVMTMSLGGGQPKKARKSQLQGNKTHRTHFSNLWVLLVINPSLCCQLPRFFRFCEPFAWLRTQDSTITPTSVERMPCGILTSLLWTTLTWLRRRYTILLDFRGAILAFLSCCCVFLITYLFFANEAAQRASSKFHVSLESSPRCWL